MTFNKKNLLALSVVLILLVSFHTVRAFSFKQFFHNILGVNKVENNQPAASIGASVDTIKTETKTETTPIKDTNPVLITPETVDISIDTELPNTNTTKETKIILKYGMKNSTNVQILQKRLVILGYLKGITDGNYGKLTVDSVANFQKDNNIDADGTIVGSFTLEALKLTLPKDKPIIITTTDTSINPKIVTTPTKPTSCSNYQYLTQWGTQGTGNGQFGNSPFGITTDYIGNVYVVDMGNNRIQKFTSNGIYITQWGSYGTGKGQFIGPHGIAIDSKGNVYVTETSNSRIQKFNSDGTYITEWGTYGNGNGQFSGPIFIATDSTDNIYVTDMNNNRIQKFNSSGTYLTQWGTQGSGNGQFNYPYGIAVDSTDNIYVTDFNNNRIQKFTSNGIYVTKWGTLGSGNSQFSHPADLVTDSINDVYVVDTDNNRIQKFTSSGTYLTQWGTGGLGNGQFMVPRGITTDSKGYIYATDGTIRVQKFGCAIPPPPSMCSINSFTVPTSTTIASGLSVTTSWSSNCQHVVLEANSGSYTLRHVGGPTGTYTFTGGSGTSFSTKDNSVDITLITGNSNDTISQTKSVPITDITSPALNQCVFSSLTATPNPTSAGSPVTLSWVAQPGCIVYVESWTPNANGLTTAHIWKPGTYYFDATDSVVVAPSKSTTYYISAQAGSQSPTANTTVLSAKTIDLKVQ